RASAPAVNCCASADATNVIATAVTAARRSATRRALSNKKSVRRIIGVGGDAEAFFAPRYVIDLTSRYVLSPPIASRSLPAATPSEIDTCIRHFALPPPP